MEKKSIDRLWAWGIAICVMLLLMQLHDILLRREKLLYDAAYEQGYRDGSGEEEEDTGFLDSEHLWKI